MWADELTVQSQVVLLLASCPALTLQMWLCLTCVAALCCFVCVCVSCICVRLLPSPLVSVGLPRCPSTLRARQHTAGEPRRGSRGSRAQAVQTTGAQSSSPAAVMPSVHQTRTGSGLRETTGSWHASEGCSSLAVQPGSTAVHARVFWKAAVQQYQASAVLAGLMRSVWVLQYSITSLAVAHPQVVSELNSPTLSGTAVSEAPAVTALVLLCGAQSRPAHSRQPRCLPSLRLHCQGAV